MLKGSGWDSPSEMLRKTEYFRTVHHPGAQNVSSQIIRLSRTCIHCQAWESMSQHLTLGYKLSKSKRTTVTQWTRRHVNSPKNTTPIIYECAHLTARHVFLYSDPLNRYLCSTSVSRRMIQQALNRVFPWNSQKNNDWFPPVSTWWLRPFSVSRRSGGSAFQEVRISAHLIGHTQRALFSHTVLYVPSVLNTQPQKASSTSGSRCILRL